MTTKVNRINQTENELSATLYNSCAPLAKMMLSSQSNPCNKAVPDWTKKDFNDWFEQFALMEKTAGEIIAEAMKKARWTQTIFTDKTEYSKTVFKDLQNPTKEHKISTVATMCIALKFSFVTSIHVMLKAGCSFESKGQKAYYLLFSFCQGMSIEKCNYKLSDWGVDERFYLGSGYDK